MRAPQRKPSLPWSAPPGSWFLHRTPLSMSCTCRALLAEGVGADGQVSPRFIETGSGHAEAEMCREHTWGVAGIVPHQGRLLFRVTARKQLNDLGTA